MKAQIFELILFMTLFYSDKNVHFEGSKQESGYTHLIVSLG